MNQQPDGVVTYLDQQSGFRIIKGHARSSVYAVALALRKTRAQPDADVTDDHDASADVYVLYKDDRPDSTLRVNQARRGLLDCEEFYPQAFMNKHRDVIGSASRFARDPELSPDASLMRHFIREVWRNQYDDGMRVDIINVHQRMIIYYERLGYRILCNSFFRHPRINTPSFVMCLLADPDAGTSLKDAFSSQQDKLMMELLRSTAPICWSDACASRTVSDVVACPRFACSTRLQQQ